MRACQRMVTRPARRRTTTPVMIRRRRILTFYPLDGASTAREEPKGRDPSKARPARKGDPDRECVGLLS